MAAGSARQQENNLVVLDSELLQARLGENNFDDQQPLILRDFQAMKSKVSRSETPRVKSFGGGPFTFEKIIYST